jgi:hypothetical protein
VVVVEDRTLLAPQIQPDVLGVLVAVVVQTKILLVQQTQAEPEQQDKVSQAVLVTLGVHILQVVAAAVVLWVLVLLLTEMLAQVALAYKVVYREQLHTTQAEVAVLAINIKMGIYQVQVGQAAAAPV